MITVKTSKERKAARIKQREEQRKAMFKMFQELSKTHNVTDAVIITANKFNVSTQLIYTVRREMNHKEDDV